MTTFPDSHPAETLIKQIQGELARLPPLTIRQAEFADPVLTLSGDTWSFSTLSAWRIVQDGKLSFGWSQPEAADLVWDLCGQSILAVRAQSPLMPGDPAFELSGGEWLEVFADHSVDPWTLHLPTMIFVGSPTGTS